MTTNPAPNHAYYRACEGDWSSPLSIVVHDAGVLRRSGMSLGNRLMLRMTAVWPRWLGRLRLHTTVRYDRAGEVVHTTTVRWCGIPMQRSTEVIALHTDGRGFSVHGGMTGTGEIDALGTAAEYRLRWFGVDLRQRTVREEGRVLVEQEGPGFSASQALVRRPALGVAAH